MSAFSLSRTESPQAFVSSFAPRVRTYQNSLLTPAIQPQNAIPPLRTTKRGTTAINYSEDFENDSLVEDSDAPRRPTGLRSLRQNESQTVVTIGPVQSTELTSAVDVQGIWREWMGKPKKAMTERQVMLQAQLPLNLVPIRIDLSVSPFQPEAPLPKPNNARELGVDENSPAYKAPDMTPEFRIKDSFLWNLHEALMTPDQFAKVFVDELDFPLERRPALAIQVSQQIRTQLEEHAAVVMHPLFNPTSTTTETRNISTRPPISREISSTPFAQTPSAQQPQTNGVNTPNAAQTPLPNDANVSAVAQPLPPSSVHNPDDAHRCIISLSINLMNRLYTDKFEWSLMHPAGFPEIFAKQTCADLGLSGEWVPALAHAIYEAVLKLKKEYCENNGSLLAVIGSGIDAWGQIDNEAAEVHGDGSLAIGEAAGWRFDNDDLGAEWQPRVEVLSKDEIEKREGDRERQIRRQRREMAARANAGFAPPPALANDYFGSQSGAGDEERMGRGERSKKKRRFRSLSPTGRETPDFTAAFGGEQGKLTESERPVWQCSHCRIGGNAVWAVRDGPNGPRVSFCMALSTCHNANKLSQSLCNNCGLLYERDKRLPPWAKDLYLVEQPKPSR
jgi:chromatin structure-remodeling complex subunit SFH1